ncbi:mucin-4 isoform X2 [Ceratitis capitata]|uniref:Uncharacterized protein n=1 Tax=Ceratitis capitata TaxID=7213 RepID=W8AI21_CERCA|nr:mucin-4 isoform X2 [Ceratitis capitata]
MTSLNGDTFVMRNGRSTSQVSIYNYPEHLNPFYEDEQHKRLRFWKINKSGGGGSRRNSFSLGGLKDVWTFKSFRLKKKSSTLGINKTSESPPPLRRDLQPYNTLNGNDLSLPDYRTRYSTPAGINDNFQRNAAYRSSLQNVASEKDNGVSHLDFNRNNQYRSTIQVMGTKSNNYNNNNTRTTPVPQPRRSSQISMASTNPFETDDDDDENNEDISLAGDRLMITSTPNKQRIHRKKRRAPAPPTVGVHKTNTSADSSLDISLSPQPLPELRIEECMDIANLTAAIEDFVKTTNEDAAEPAPVAVVNQQTTQTQEPTITSFTTKPNGEATQVSDNTHGSPSEIRKEATKVEINHKSEESASQETAQSLDPSDACASNDNTDQPQIVTETEVGHVECIHVHMGSPNPTPSPVEISNENKLTSFRSNETRTPEPQQPITTKTSFTLTTPPTTRRDSVKRAKVTLKTTETLKFPETEPLRITENVTTPKATKSPNSEKPILAAKPHIAEIHKPARGLINSFTGVHSETVNESQSTARPVPPMSPVPPKRHSAATRMSQKNVVEPKIELKVEQEAATSATSQTDTQALVITESREDLLEKNGAEINDVDNKQQNTNTPQRTQSPNELREEVLESLYRPKPTTSYMEWKQSSLAPLEKNVPPEKRKSVKDIIESINRSQRLLNASAHKDTTHNGSSLSLGPGSASGTPLPRRKFSGHSVNENGVTSESQRSAAVNGNSTTSDHDLNEDSVPSTSTAAGNKTLNGVGNDQDPNKLNNNEIFKKCTVKKDVQYDYREQSPTASNLDWNPVPKPKRNKNLSEQ